MKLLIITQKADADDFNLGFFHGWIKRFALKFDRVSVIALGAGRHDFPANVNVYSLGKEKGVGRWRKIFNFYRLIFKLRRDYDAVFVHMNPEYAVLAGWLWRRWKKPVYLWYVHKAVPWQLRRAEKWVKRIFTASEESCRLESRGKIVVVGHGIDTDLFAPGPGRGRSEKVILSAGRMSRVKHYEVILGAEKILKSESGTWKTILIAPIIDEAGRGYDKELRATIGDWGLRDDVEIIPGAHNNSLPAYYNAADVFAHASETGSIDKVVLEAMACGTPVLSSSEAFDFLPEKYKFKKGDSAELARKIKILAAETGPDRYLRNIVVEKFSLANLVDKIISDF